MNQFETVKNMLMSMEADFVKFYDKGNSAAGTRVRKGLQDLKVKCQELRLEIQNMSPPPYIANGITGKGERVIQHE